MSASSSSASASSGAVPKGPTCKICCACPAERRARDECTIFNNVEDCKEQIAAFYQCLIKEGFSQEEVDKLKRNTRSM